MAMVKFCKNFFSKILYFINYGSKLDKIWSIIKCRRFSCYKCYFIENLILYIFIKYKIIDFLSNNKFFLVVLNS